MSRERLVLIVNSLPLACGVHLVNLVDLALVLPVNNQSFSGFATTRLRNLGHKLLLLEGPLVAWPPVLES
jgi:hypothetical protein